MIAVSSTSDPTGAWIKWAIDADMDDDVQTNNSADFPGLGVDAFNVYVTANMFNGTTPNTARCGSSRKPSCWRDRSTITWFEFRRSPGIRFHHATRPHLRDPRRGVFPLRGIDQPQLRLTWIDNVSGTPVWHAPLPVPVTPYIFDGFLPGAPQPGHRRHDRHVGHAPAERRVPERLRLGHPPRRRPERKSRGRLVPDRPGNRHGASRRDGSTTRSAGTTTPPSRSTRTTSPRSGSAARRPPNSPGGITPHPAVHRHRGARGAAEGGRGPLLENLRRGRESMGRFQRDRGRPRRRHVVLDAAGIREDARYFIDNNNNLWTVPMGDLVGKVPSHKCPLTDRADRHGWTTPAVSSSTGPIPRQTKPAMSSNGRPGRRERSESSSPP